MYYKISFLKFVSQRVERRSQDAHKLSVSGNEAGVRVATATGTSEAEAARLGVMCCAVARVWLWNDMEWVQTRCVSWRWQRVRREIVFAALPEQLHVVRLAIDVIAGHRVVGDAANSTPDCRTRFRFNI